MQGTFPLLIVMNIFALVEREELLYVAQNRRKEDFLPDQKPICVINERHEEPSYSLTRGQNLT